MNQYLLNKSIKKLRIYKRWSIKRHDLKGYPINKNYNYFDIESYKLHHDNNFCGYIDNSL